MNFKKSVAAALAATTVLSMTACGSAATGNSSAAKGEAKAWPQKTVTVEVAASAGGGTDSMARIFTNYLQKATGEAITVVDDATGNGTVAFEAVRNAEPDGNTLLFYHSTMAIQYYQDGYEFNPADPANFTVIANIPNGGTSDVLCVPSSAEYKTIEEFIDYCKNHPGEVTFGNQNGGFGQLECLLLGSRADIDVKFVDAGGQADTIVSLLGGNIDACFISADAASQYQQSGDMIPLATCDSERSDYLPEVPTLSESGYDVVFKPTMVLLGPGNMDQALVDEINKTFDAMAEDEETVTAYGNMNQSYTPCSATDAKKIWEDHCATIKEVCELAGYDVSNK